MHLPAAMDGGPHQMVDAGRHLVAVVDDRPAGGDASGTTRTCTAHTADHVYRGAAGMFLIDDPAAAPDLPRDLRRRRHPAGRAGQARSTATAASMRAPRSFDTVGFLGDTLVVNGTVDPHLDVTTERVRLRLLNASNARVYDFGFADDREFALVATDAGLLGAPAPHRTASSCRPASGPRSSSTSSPASARSCAASPPDMGVPVFERFAGGDDSFDVLELRAAATLAPSPAVPERLATIDRPDPDEAVRDAGVPPQRHEHQRPDEMDLDRVDEVVTVDTTEVWEVRNTDGNPHSFHPHLVHFAVLDIDGDPPPPELAGWKDTIYVPPNTDRSASSPASTTTPTPRRPTCSTATCSPTRTTG